MSNNFGNIKFLHVSSITKRDPNARELLGTKNNVKTAAEMLVELLLCFLSKKIREVNLEIHCMRAFCMLS